MRTINLKNILTLSACLGLISCIGQSSDPMGKYSQLKSSEPTSQTSEHQIIAPDVFTQVEQLEPGELLNLNPQLLELNLQGSNDVNNAHFNEEQQGVLYFKVFPKSTKIIKYEIVLTDLKLGSQTINHLPTIQPTNKENIFGLAWKAPTGIIPNGLNFVILKAKIVMSITEASDSRLKDLIDEDFIYIALSRIHSVPKILGHSSLKEGIDEGQAKPFTFTLDIEDPGTAFSPKFPEIQITPYIYSNTEAFRVDGSRFVELDPNKMVNPEKLIVISPQDKSTSTTWRFHFRIIIDQLPLNRDREGVENPNFPSVDLCFHISAISVLSTQSVKQQICLNARYAAQAPDLNWHEGTSFDVISGKNNVLKFNIKSANDLGETSLKDPAKQITGLSGTKDLKCSHETSDKLSFQICELTWAPKCVKKKTEKKLTLNLNNKTGNKTKSKSVSTVFNILPNEEDCQKKPAPKAPAKNESNGKGGA